MGEGKFTQTGVFRTPRTQAQQIGTNPAGFGDSVPGQPAQKLARDPLASAPFAMMKAPTTPTCCGT